MRAKSIYEKVVAKDDRVAPILIIRILSGACLNENTFL